MANGIDQLDGPDIARVTEACSRVNVNAGDTVLQKDETSDEMYIVSEGTFKVFDDTPGEDFVYAVLEKGDVFGEMSFLDGAPRSASVTAVSDGTLLKMGKEEFGALLADSPDTATLLIFTLARVITRRLRDVNVALRDITFGDAATDTEDVVRDLIARMRLVVHLELASEDD